MNALPIAILLLTIFGVPFGWLWWEYRHAMWVDDDEQPIDLRTLPIRDAAVLVQVDELMPELAAFLGGEGRRS